MEVAFPGNAPLEAEVKKRKGSEQTEQTTAIPKKRWSEFVLGVKDTYQRWKKDLVKRTDKTLEQAADVYMAQYEAERDPVTGEVPESYLKKFARGFQALRQSTSLQSRFELGIRAILPAAEFNTQMAFKQFGVDIAIRQAEYVELEHAYEAKGGMKAVERQALDFAQQVQAHFLRLNEQSKQLPPESETDREAFRQRKITEGLEYAEQLLQGIELVDQGAKAKLMAELRTYLDTVVYDPSRSELLQRWDKFGRGYRGAIQDIINRHVDIYQKRSARNKAIFTTAARWLTFGLEAYVVNRLGSAANTLRTNYDKVLMQLPPEQRTLAKRMGGFASSVKEGFLQVAMNDQYRQLRERSTAIDALIDKELFSYDWESGLSGQFPVDEVTREFYAKFETELKRKGISEQQLYEMVEAEAYKLGNRRAQLADTLKYKVLELHKDQVKAAAQQAEHVYNQFNINVTAVAMLAEIDATTEQLLGVREHVGTVLEGLSQQVGEVRTVVEQSGVENLANGLVEEVSAAIHQLTETAHAIEHPQVVDSPVYDEEAEVESLPAIPPAEAVQHHTVAPRETLWLIAKNHLEAYQAREQNEDLSIVDVVHLIQQENNIPDPSKLEVGTDLKLASWVPLERMELIEWETAEESKTLSREELIALAKEADEQKPDGRLVEGATRENLGQLPPGEYELVLGERLGKSSGRMPVYYSDVAHLSVGLDGVLLVRESGQPEESAVPLDWYLGMHKSPIVRVFETERFNVGLPFVDLYTPEHRMSLPVEHIRPEEMSQYNRALIRYLQDHPVTVLEKEGAYCAKDMAARLDLFDPSLAADVGVNLRDGEGQETGVTVHAPMLAETIEVSGGQRVADLNQFFVREENGTKPTETLESTNPEYRQAVRDWLGEAAESPFRLGTFLYRGTHIQHIIEANAGIGGEANSHVVTLLGEKDLTAEVHTETTVAQVLKANFHVSGDALAQRGWVLESLGVEVRNQHGETTLITQATGWEELRLQPGDTVVIHDVALNHRFNGDRVDTLAMMMVKNPDLLPVSILEPNGRVVNEALAYQGEANDYVVDTFEQVKAGDSLGDIFARAGLDQGLWTAAQFVLAERGIDPAHIKPGELVPIYNEAELRDHLDEIYERAERRLVERIAPESETGVNYAAADRLKAEEALQTAAQLEMELAGTTYWHIVRPNESMDQLTQQFFDRSNYSTAEWNEIRMSLASQLGIQSSKVEMPGDEYTAPYSVDQYELTANAELHITLDQLREIERTIERGRLAERTYIPDSIPLFTSEGVVEQEVPHEVIQLVDTVVDAHPEYGEEVRVALGLIYANEGLREEAEKTALSHALESVNQDHSLDATIEDIEYYSSRQFLKDIAWAIHDSPKAHYVLQEAISSFESGYLSRQAYLDRVAFLYGGLFPAEVAEEIYDTIGVKMYEQLEKLEGISSAGLFQVRANNFLPEGTPEFEQLERDLRADPLLNTAAAAELTHQNARVIDTYLQAFGDPKSQDEEAKILAVVNAYNGGPYKTILGGLQANMLRLEQASHVDTALDRATGRNTAETREAFEELCLGLAEQGKLQVTPEQIRADSALLGSHTMSFLRSETMQEFKRAYVSDVGQPMSLLPDSATLSQEQISYGNYAYLATRGGALEKILNHSEETRIVKGEALRIPYARTEAPFVSGNFG